jgi:hypothetical protein
MIVITMTSSQKGVTLTSPLGLFPIPHRSVLTLRKSRKVIEANLKMAKSVWTFLFALAAAGGNTCSL